MISKKTVVTKNEDSSVDNSKNIGGCGDTKFASSNVEVGAKLRKRFLLCRKRGTAVPAADSRSTGR